MWRSTSHGLDFEIAAIAASRAVQEDPHAFLDPPASVKTRYPLTSLAGAVILYLDLHPASAENEISIPEGYSTRTVHRLLNALESLGIILSDTLPNVGAEPKRVYSLDRALHHYIKAGLQQERDDAPERDSLDDLIRDHRSGIIRGLEYFQPKTDAVLEHVADRIEQSGKVGMFRRLLLRVLLWARWPQPRERKSPLTEINGGLNDATLDVDYVLNLMGRPPEANGAIGMPTPRRPVGVS